MTFSNLYRRSLVNQLKRNPFDVLIIGGGITGAGVALDAVTRGMTVALIEMQDFAAGTSSRSTKLIHGGLRYLKQFEIKMVAEVGKERKIVYDNGPHVTKPVGMLLPFYQDGKFGKFTTALGLWVYDFLAGVSKQERRMMLTAEEVLQREPLIKHQGLVGGGIYVEYQTDDARLTLEVLKEAVEKGAIAVNYMKANEFLYAEGKAVGVVVKDQITREAFTIRAKKIVNATGPWVDEVRERNASKNGKTVRLTKGVHIVVEAVRFPLKQAIYFDTFDRRMVFAIPRGSKIYIGTTDTFVEKATTKPQVTVNDQAYLIKVINEMFPNTKLSHKDIVASWAGLRPLINESRKKPSEISRKDEIWISSTGLISIAGGKLTGYRKMAEKIVNLVSKQFKEEENLLFPPCRTKEMVISGGHVGGAANLENYIVEQIPKGVELGFTAKEAKNLVSFYGSNIQKLYALLEDQKSEWEKYQLPLQLFAKLIYSIEYEMIASPVDFFYRRTAEILFDTSQVKQWKNQVLTFMDDRFSWTEDLRNEYETALDEELNSIHTL